MLTVMTYWWTDKSKSKFATYTADDVRVLKGMVARNLTVPHQFAVVTDQPELFTNDADIRAIPIDMETHVPGTCFVRLMTFHPNGQKIFGDQVFQIDLDTIPVANFDHVVQRDEKLVLWRNPSRVPWDDPDRKGRPYYNTSFVLHRCGTAPGLNMCFDPRTPLVRDDQWWVAEMMGGDVPYWDGTHGVYRLGREDTPGSGVMGELPDNACLVTFPGSEGKYWEPEILKANPWIAEHRF